MEGASYTSALKGNRMNLWFLSWLLSENTSPSQSRQTKYELRAVSSKVGLFQETNTLRNKMPEQMLCVLKPDIRCGSLSNPSKAQSRAGALTFFSAGLPLSPGSLLHYKTSDTKASGRYWRWANHFPGIPIQPEAAEVLLQIRGEAEKSGETDMAEWHWDLFWQYAGTRSSPVIPLETQGARQMINSCTSALQMPMSLKMPFD